MTAASMHDAILRGIENGLYLGATTDTRGLSRLRHQAETTNHVAESWQAVGAMLQKNTAANCPMCHTAKENSSLGTK